MIYVICFSIIIVSYLLLYHNDIQIIKYRKLWFCVISGLVLWLLVALRSIYIGISDTAGIYLHIYQFCKNHSFMEVLQDQSLNGSLINGKLFYLLSKIISTISPNYHIFIAIIGIPYILAVHYVIYKYSDFPLVSVFTFISIYYLYSFFLLRQVVAMSIFLVAFDSIKRKNFKRYFLLCMISFLIHQSAIILFLAYFFCKYIKFSFRNYILIAICFFVGFVAPNIVFAIIGASGVVDISYITIHGIYDTSGAISMFGLVVTVSILAFCHLQHRSKFNDHCEQYEEDILYNLSTIGSMVYCFSAVVTEFYRLSIYFSIFNILLLANSISRIKSRSNRMIATFCVMLLLIAYFFVRSINNTNANPYQFFWRDTI